MTPCGCTISRCRVCSGVTAYRQRPPSLLLFVVCMLAAMAGIGLLEGAEHAASSDVETWETAR